MPPANEEVEQRRHCLDKALKYLAQRQHSRAELSRKLARGKFLSETIDGVLNELSRLDYLNDLRFATAKAQSAARNKKHGPRRAMMELMKAGVKQDVARGALDQVYAAHDALAVARELARKQTPRLRKLDPQTARRRLAGMLQRRGFESDDIATVAREFLGAADFTAGDA